MRDISSRLIINSIECPLIDIMLLQRDQSWLDDGGNAIGLARIVEFEISRQELSHPPICRPLLRDRALYVEYLNIFRRALLEYFASTSYRNLTMLLRSSRCGKKR